jgi:hypothetical protein
VPVDIRFDSTQQRSPGQLLCLDVDFSSLPSGITQPGSRLITQIWSKRIDHNGTTAVLFINADTNLSHDITVDLAQLISHTVGSPIEVRDVWHKSGNGTTGRGVYCAACTTAGFYAANLYTYIPSPTLLAARSLIFNDRTARRRISKLTFASAHNISRNTLTRTSALGLALDCTSMY